MFFQALVLSVQILLLVIGYYLFQRARAELSVHAAEAPVLGEVKALHRSVKQLLNDLTTTAETTSAELEARFAESQEILAALDQRMTALQELEAAAEPEKPAKRRSAPVRNSGTKARTEEIQSHAAVVMTPQSLSPAEKRQEVYRRADAGDVPNAIAQAVGLSEGEVETLLGLRLQRSA